MYIIQAGNILRTARSDPHYNSLLTNTVNTDIVCSLYYIEGSVVAVIV